MLILKEAPGKVEALAFAPDGRVLASASGRSPVIHLWDLSTFQVREE